MKSSSAKFSTCENKNEISHQLLSGFALVMALTGCNYRVNSTIDAPDANPGDWVCAAESSGGPPTGDDSGLCTLRAAIMEANASFLGVDYIEVPAGTYILDLPGNDGGGSLNINQDMKIHGAGAATTIIQGDTNTGVIFDINGGDAQINNVTIQESGRFTPHRHGGGIRVRNANLELVDAVVRDNWGTGVHISFNSSSTIRRCSIISNKSEPGVGGIRNEHVLFIYDSLIANNISGEFVGGIANTGFLTMRNTTVSGNETVDYDNDGIGGIYQGGVADLNNVTITDNTGHGDDFNDFGTGGLLTGNDSLTVLKNSIIANNHGAGVPDDCNGPLGDDSAYNLIGNSEGCEISNFISTFLLDLDAVSLNEVVNDLANYGGPTGSHLPTISSLAINAGSPSVPGSAGSACSGYDQRGMVRSLDFNNCDMGAVERSGYNGGSQAVYVTFILVDADANVDIQPLLYGETLFLDELPANLSIRAEVNGNVDHVVFDFDGMNAVQTEYGLPYSLGGDANGDYQPVLLTTGDHSLRATAFLGLGLGISLSVGGSAITSAGSSAINFRVEASLK